MTVWEFLSIAVFAAGVALLVALVVWDEIRWCRRMRDLERQERGE